MLKSGLREARLNTENAEIAEFNARFDARLSNSAIFAISALIVVLVVLRTSCSDVQLLRFVRPIHDEAKTR